MNQIEKMSPTRNHQNQSHESPKQEHKIQPDLMVYNTEEAA
jgi:hypothetical protein